MLNNKSVVILLILCMLLFVGCQPANTPSLGTTVFQTGEDDVTARVTISIEMTCASEEPIPTGSDTTVLESSAAVDSNPSETTISVDPSEQLSAPPQTVVSQPVETEKVPVPSDTEIPNTDPPKTAELEPPKTVESVPPSPTGPPETPEVSESVIFPEDALISGKQYCDLENDPYGVVAIIRAYAESDGRGFILNESLRIENSGYRGHPNITDWTLNGVIDTLKYHVDKLLEIQGPSYYNVVYRVCQGKLEYYFLVQ